MQTRLQLWHTWQAQLRPLLPHVRATCAANLALFALGLLWAGKAGQEVVLVFDPTPQNGDPSILGVGLVTHKRVLPLTWRGLPQQEPWPDRQIDELRAMATEVGAALPPAWTVTLVADRGITGSDVIDLCAEIGWHYVLRVSVGPAQANRERRPATPDGRLWDLVTGPGQRWAGSAELFKAAGWRAST